VQIPARAIATPDDFVNRKPEPEPVEPMIRLSVDLPESLHMKLKMKCVASRQKMAEAVRRLIERDLAEAA
jgi:hypothetical protein